MSKSRREQIEWIVFFIILFLIGFCVYRFKYSSVDFERTALLYDKDSGESAETVITAEGTWNHKLFSKDTYTGTFVIEGLTDPSWKLQEYVSAEDMDGDGLLYYFDDPDGQVYVGMMFAGDEFSWCLIMISDSYDLENHDTLHSEYGFDSRRYIVMGDVPEDLLQKAVQG